MWPSGFGISLNIFQRLILVRVIRPDQLIQGFEYLINEFMGEEFVNFQPEDILSLIEEASPVKPIIFIISKGSDPSKDFETVAAKMQMKDKFLVKSMGQG